jgi:hypothetical protein
MVRVGGIQNSECKIQKGARGDFLSRAMMFLEGFGVVPEPSCIFVLVSSSLLVSNFCVGVESDS